MINTPLNDQSICPFLGIPSDERTAMAYPSTQNYCHHVHPVVSPAAAYQRKFCLDAANSTCPVFVAAKGTQMPAEMMADKPRKLPFRNLTYVWVLVVIELAVGAAAVWALFNLTLNHTPADKAPGALASETPYDAWAAPTVISTSTPLPTPTPTRLPPTPTLTPQPLHFLETPIGASPQFLLHRVVQGESMLSLATTYSTTPDAIRAVNYELGSLWANDVLVIPLGRSDVSTVFPMTAYLITTDGVTAESLAAEQSVDPVLLRKLNALPQGYQFELDEWVLIPHPSPAP